jgi:hypothetical protein
MNVAAFSIMVTIVASQTQQSDVGMRFFPVRIPEVMSHRTLANILEDTLEVSLQHPIPEL